MTYEFHNDIKMFFIVKKFVSFNNVWVADSFQYIQFIFETILIKLILENMALFDNFDSTLLIESEIQGLLYKALRSLSQNITKFQYIIDIINLAQCLKTTIIKIIYITFLHES